MNRLTAALMVAGISAAARAEWEPPTRTDWTLLLVSEALIAVDAAQTVGWCNRPEAVHCEQGLAILVLGSKPSTEQIIGASIGAGVGTAVLWYILPQTWRQVFSVTVTVAEGANVIANFGVVRF